MENVENIVKVWNVLYTAISSFGLKCLMTLVVFFIGKSIVKWTSKKFNTSKILDKMDTNLRSFMSSSLNIVLYALLLVVCANILGIDTSSFIAVLASCGVAIGLALQGALSNVAGGIMILIFHPFHVGDFIEAAGITGTVKAIAAFSTVVETPDNKRITVPNAFLTSGNIINYSVNGQRRVDLEFSVAYESDIDLVKKVMLQTAKAHALVLKQPEPFARMSKQEDSALIFTLRVWCNNADYWTVYFDLNENMKKAFDQNNINIPFPQLDVHLDK